MIATIIQTPVKRYLTAFNNLPIARALLAFKASVFIPLTLFALFALTAPLSLKAETYTDLDRAIAATIARQKPLMIVVMQTTCPYCRQYWINTLNAEGVMERLSREVIVYESYLDKGGVFPTDYPWTGTVPTTYFVSPTGELIGQPLVGVIPLEQFIPYVSQLLDYFYQSREAAIYQGFGR
jgi:thioredoxin-related protein